MSDAALYHEELADLEQQVESILTGVDNQLKQTSASSNNNNVNVVAARSAKFAKAQDLLRRLNRLLQQLRVEVRLLDGDERTVYEGKVAEHVKCIASLKERAQQCRERAAQSAAAATTTTAAGSRSTSNSAAYRSVEGGHGVVWSPREGAEEDAENGGDGPAMSNRPEARQAAGRINEVQQSTLQSLGQSEKLLNETETVGAEAATTLRAQTEQIKHVNEELDEMHGEIGRASTELKSFMRRMARDRLVIFFIIAIVVCIIVIVVLAVVKHYVK
ncbi:putative Qa-SNARE protein [Leptomonas pyrrhocoris]|uniref:Putative Qa-SNARE protein n=1 Tax=Leptomonas pyrrhocoris TaxID=157538 RepID=A0A0N0VDP2_LEPPY|nr:putative Qa-SNARE protein [Leptomonas pyrrhocoris]KPA76121.1 putative Qa-SNARE protein [Leptomonas pyrrhocoris]|eukprot:XP_015654560.1 putative Qa-SNARE protein [Leptomonas pyrrhocoris]